MRVTPVPAAERDLLTRFVRFLNDPIEDTTQIENLFRGAILGGGKLQTIAADEVDAYRNDQRHLRTVVGPLVAAFGRPRRLPSVVRELAPQVQEGLRDKPVQATLVTDERGAQVRYTFDGVVLCCWVAVGLLLDRDRGLLGRFGRCGACGRYNLFFTGRPRRHCSAAHLDQFRRQTGAERTARSRARRKRQQRKEK
jgi:hypothetical protein